MQRRAPVVIRRAWKAWIKPVVVVVAVVATMRSSLADWNDVPTQSMEPTILAGDRIVVNKLAYGLRVPFTPWRLVEFAGPARGDVVVFLAPDTGRRMVKRVVGVPGDVVEMRGNRLLLNGAPVVVEPIEAADGGADWGADDLTDPPPHRFGREALGPVAHTLMLQPGRSARRSFPPVTVPPGHCWLMGDNRDNSGDSRSFGPVPDRRILGRAFGIAISLDRDGACAPRWRRFLRGLD